MVYYNEIYIDNQKRAYGDTNQFNIILDRALTNVKAIRYIKSQIPKTYYSVNSFNNVLRFVEDVGAQFSATIPAGNYTATEFASALKTAMDASSTNVRTYTCTYSSITNKITISINAGTFAVLGSNALSTGHLLAGFGATDTAQAVSHVGGLVQRASTYPEEIYIRGTIGQCTKSQIDGTNTSNNILVKVDTTSVSKNELINDYNYQPDAFLSDATIDNVESYCTYEDINTGIPRIIDFNGGHWSYVVGLYNKIE